MIPLQNSGALKNALSDVRSLDEIWVLIPEDRGASVAHYIENEDEAEEGEPPEWQEPYWLRSRDLNRLADEHREAVFRNRIPATCARASDGYLAVKWIHCDDEAPLDLMHGSYSEACYLVSLGTPKVVGFRLHKAIENVYPALVLNRDHWFGQWIELLRSAVQSRQYDLSPADFERLMRNVREPLRFPGYQLDKLTEYLNLWRTTMNVPDELKPLDQPLSKAMFLRHL